MSDSIDLNGTRFSVLKGDITDLDIESFVFYAREDLKLGSGFGTAISIRGGQSIQEELESLAPAKTTEVIISKAGELKANYILHAVGPKFMEEDLDNKLRRTILNTLKAAIEKGIKKIALPPMGAGFYGVPLETSADITINTIAEFLNKGSQLEEVVVCALDNREFKPFRQRLDQLTKA